MTTPSEKPTTITTPAAAREAIGRVVAVSGAHATLGITGKTHVTVGTFLGITTGSSTAIGMITEITETPTAEVAHRAHNAVAQIDLVGEIRNSGKPDAFFQRGITDYPTIGNPSYTITPEQTKVLYRLGKNDAITIGELHEEGAGGATVNVDEMITKHFSILGTTGVGKSSGVAVLLREILQARPDLRIMLIDPHNEYARCFDDKAQVMTPRNLRLPFWLFNFEEIADVFFGGRPGVDEEMQALAEAIPMAKSAYLQYRNNNDRGLGKKKEVRSAGFTVDTPVPYRIEDLVGMLDEQMGKLENRTSRMMFFKLISRIQTVRNDPRYAFMFENANIGGDTMAEVISNLFRLPANGRPMTIMQLAGFPAEVVDSVVSVLGRMAFDFGLWSDGVAPLLFVCEEAHRYAPADKKIGFGPTRRALSRIAKEGRKYGVFLGLVTQRPAEIDSTIISQCSTLFVMRMANERDQALVRSAVSDAAANLLTFIPSLGTREVFAFGIGVSVPTRLRFKELPANVRPQSEAGGTTQSDPNGVHRDLIGSVVERWRSASMSQKSTDDAFTTDAAFPAEAMPSVAAATLSPAPPIAPAPPIVPRITPTLSPKSPTAIPSLDPDRFSLLRKEAGQAPAAPQPFAPVKLR